MAASIAASSFVLLLVLQADTESTIRNGLYQRQVDKQTQTTNSISQSIGSDLGILVSMLDGLAESELLQQGIFTGDQTAGLIEEKLGRYGTEVNDVFILDDNDVVRSIIPGPGFTIDDATFLRVGDDLSQRQWVKGTKLNSPAPHFSGGFERQGIYKIFLAFPIVSRVTNENLGIVGASFSTIPFFSRYGNLEDFNKDFLMVLDKRGIILTDPGDQGFLGQNFFGQFVQDFIGGNRELNNLTRNLLEGHSGHAVYDYGKGERITTQEPILINGKPEFFVQAITPTAGLYSDIGSLLFDERIRLFLFFGASLAGVIALVLYLLKWNRALKREVGKRTNELEVSNRQLIDANKQLAANNRLQNEFINIAAHELRTPIQPILSLSAVLRDIVDVSFNGDGRDKIRQQNEMIDVIARNAIRLKDLTNDILDVSRIESSNLKLERERVNLVETIRNVIKEISTTNRQVKESVVAIQFMDGRKNNGTDCYLDADRSRLIQVLTNLINNSIKFTKEGTISVTIEKDDINNHIIVRIKDTGKGIDAEILPRLFTKFVTKSNRGSGLGLYICRGIVEAHGGRIWGENNPCGKNNPFGKAYSIQDCRGATFSFSLPLN
ncbi:MAG TPA: sensor histidine kinase [Nitrososphaeraceae archaeon]|nr:sensor histidine kinase [Nitrososphaeraceae archaeon]